MDGWMFVLVGFWKKVEVEGCAGWIVVSQDETSALGGLN